MIKENSWVNDIIEALNILGGDAKYNDIYQKTEKIRISKNRSHPPSIKATIRRTVEDHSSESANFRGVDVFYSIAGLGKGHWGLLPEYLNNTLSSKAGEIAYSEGLEGIIKEIKYLRKSRDTRLVEARKTKDNFTCQACKYKKSIRNEKYIIDVHHLNPISSLQDVVITGIEDLVCLCPNCHRIAHSKSEKPYTIEEIKKYL